jgi:type IV secretory pathway VirD2 relaxase
MEQLQKVSIAPDAEQALEEMFQLANKDFKSGKVTKANLVSWLILNFHKSHFKKSLKKIRDDHFDQIAHLKSVVKDMEEAKKSGRSVASVSLGKEALPKAIKQ